MNWVPAFLTKFWLTDFVESLWKICLGRFVLEGLSQKICLGRFVWNVCLEHSSRKVQKVLSRNLHLGMEWVIAIDLYKDQCFSYFSNLNNSIQAHFAERLWKITNHTSEHANSMSTKKFKRFSLSPLRNDLQIDRPEVEDLSPVQFWNSVDGPGICVVTVIAGNVSRDKIDDMSCVLYFLHSPPLFINW